MHKFLGFYCCIVILILLSACKEDHKHKAYGYIEGRYTYISSSISGKLVKLNVKRGEVINQGQKLATLDPQPESDLLNAAIENLSESISSKDAISADLVFAKKTWKRYQELALTNAISESALDNAHASLQSTKAQLRAAKASIASLSATLAQAKWALKQKIMLAPVKAEVFDTYYTTGEYVATNQAILSLLVPKNIKAVFYIKEEDLAKIKYNESINVTCDGCHNKITGNISFISPIAEYTPPIIYSTEMRANLVYRIEASFTDQNAVKFHPGQPITVLWR